MKGQMHENHLKNIHPSTPHYSDHNDHMHTHAHTHTDIRAMSSLQHGNPPHTHSHTRTRSQTSAISPTVDRKGEVWSTEAASKGDF